MNYVKICHNNFVKLSLLIRPEGETVFKDKFSTKYLSANEGVYDHYHYIIFNFGLALIFISRSELSKLNLSWAIEGSQFKVTMYSHLEIIILFRLL